MSVTLAASLAHGAPYILNSNWPHGHPHRDVLWSLLLVLVFISSSSDDETLDSTAATVTLPEPQNPLRSCILDNIIEYVVVYYGRYVIISCTAYYNLL